MKIGICSGNEKLDSVIQRLAVENYADKRNACIIKTYKDSFCLSDGISHNPAVIDLLFLSCNILGEDGIELAKRIKHRHPFVQIIMLGREPYDAELSYEADPAGFLRVPIDPVRFAAVFKKAGERFEQIEPDYLIVDGKSAHYRVDIRKVCYISSDKRIVTFHTDRREISYSDKLDNIEKRLPSNFLRAHQSFLINMDKVISFGTTELLLSNNVMVPITKTRCRYCHEALCNYFNIPVEE